MSSDVSGILSMSEGGIKPMEARHSEKLFMVDACILPAVSHNSLGGLS